MKTPTLATVCNMDSEILAAEIIERDEIPDFRERHGFIKSDKVEDTFCAFYTVRAIRDSIGALADLASFLTHYRKHFMQLPGVWLDAANQAVADLADTCRRKDAESDP